MDDGIATFSVLLPHDLGTGGHSSSGLTNFGRIATESPVKLTGIYLGMRATLLTGAFDLRP